MLKRETGQHNHSILTISYKDEIPFYLTATNDCNRRIPDDSNVLKLIRYMQFWSHMCARLAQIVCLGSMYIYINMYVFKTSRNLYETLKLQAK